mmetsp:Transcript_34639/g.52986  ORF Transcript_34639/g.52986 Transcript_34639/m.52986 type:complete len:264 (+) Transcript_34639:3705-4496(+)
MDRLYRLSGHELLAQKAIRYRLRALSRVVHDVPAFRSVDSRLLYGFGQVDLFQLDLKLVELLHCELLFAEHPQEVNVRFQGLALPSKFALDLVTLQALDDCFSFTGLVRPAEGGTAAAATLRRHRERSRRSGTRLEVRELTTRRTGQIGRQVHLRQLADARPVHEEVFLRVSYLARHLTLREVLTDAVHQKRIGKRVPACVWSLSCWCWTPLVFLKGMSAGEEIRLVVEGHVARRKAIATEVERRLVSIALPSLLEGAQFRRH